MFKLSFALAVLAVASAKPSLPYSTFNTGFNGGQTYLPPVATSYSGYAAPSVYSAGQAVYPAGQQTLYPAGQPVYSGAHSVYPATAQSVYPAGHSVYTAPSVYPASYPAAAPAVSYVKSVAAPVTTGHYATPAVSYVKNVAGPAISTAHYPTPVNTGHYATPVVAAPTVVKPYSAYSVQPSYYPGVTGYSGFSGYPAPIVYGSPVWKKK